MFRSLLPPSFDALPYKLGSLRTFHEEKYKFDIRGSGSQNGAPEGHRTDRTRRKDLFSTSDNNLVGAAKNY